MRQDFEKVAPGRFADKSKNQRNKRMAGMARMIMTLAEAPTAFPISMRCAWFCIPILTQPTVPQEILNLAAPKYYEHARYRGDFAKRGEW